MDGTMGNTLRGGETITIRDVKPHNTKGIKHPYFLCYVNDKDEIMAWFEEDEDGCEVIDGGFTKVFCCPADGQTKLPKQVRASVIYVKKDENGRIISALCIQQ